MNKIIKEFIRKQIYGMCDLESSGINVAPEV